MKFEGTDSYVAPRDLTLAVNAAVALQRPLLIKGEPGTGKTLLAEEVARALNMPLFQWHIKSTTKAQQGLYEYDAVSRLRDSQLGDDRVGFAIDGPTLRVTNKNVTASKILQHRGTDFTCKCTLHLLAEILRTPGNRSSGQNGLRLRQIRKRNANCCCHSTQPGHTHSNILKQLKVRLQTTEHFPVTGY